MDIYQFVGILGLIVISIGLFWQKRYLEDLLYIVGGAAMLVYSYDVGNWIFIVFQAIFILSAFTHLFRTTKVKKINQ